MEAGVDRREAQRGRFLRVLEQLGEIEKKKSAEKPNRRPLPNETDAGQ